VYEKMKAAGGRPVAVAEALLTGLADGLEKMVGQTITQEFVDKVRSDIPEMLEGFGGPKVHGRSEPHLPPGQVKKQ
jgi:hypothetical protein